MGNVRSWRPNGVHYEILLNRKENTMEWVITPEQECECHVASGEQVPCKMHLKAGYGKFYEERKKKEERRRVISTSFKRG